nr:RNA-directed DNA polymerase, eukaryota [Tanacetum cinerariifolium]
MSCDIFNLIARWWKVSIENFDCYDEWLEWIDSIRMSKKTKIMIEAVFYTSWWMIWWFRNSKIFKEKDPKNACFFDELQNCRCVWLPGNMSALKIADMLCSGYTSASQIADVFGSGYMFALQITNLFGSGHTSALQIADVFDVFGSGYTFALQIADVFGFRYTFALQIADVFGSGFALVCMHLFGLLWIDTSSSTESAL